MFIFKSKYIVIVNSNIKHHNTFKSNIDYKYQNSSLTLIENNLQILTVLGTKYSAKQTHFFLQ